MLFANHNPRIVISRVRKTIRPIRSRVSLFSRVKKTIRPIRSDNINLKIFAVGKQKPRARRSFIHEWKKLLSLWKLVKIVMKDLPGKTNTKAPKKTELALESFSEFLGSEKKLKRCQQIFYWKATGTADLQSEANENMNKVRRRKEQKPVSFETFLLQIIFSKLYVLITVYFQSKC